VENVCHDCYVAGLCALRQAVCELVILAFCSFASSRLPAQVVRVYFLWHMQVVGRRLFRAQDAQYKPRKDHKSWLELTEPLVLYDAVYGKFAKRAKGAAVNVPAVVLECVPAPLALH
jgi:hypothetical protein